MRGAKPQAHRLMPLVVVVVVVVVEDHEMTCPTFVKCNLNFQRHYFQNQHDLGSPKQLSADAPARSGLKRKSPHLPYVNPLNHAAAH